MAGYRGPHGQTPSPVILSLLYSCLGIFDALGYCYHAVFVFICVSVLLYVSLYSVLKVAQSHAVWSNTVREARCSLRALQSGGAIKQNQHTTNTHT